MSQTKALLNVVSDLRKLADSLEAIIEASNETAPVVTVEQIRAVLADKSRAGLTSNVRELLLKFGAPRLSEIAPEHYPDLLRASEELK